MQDAGSKEDTHLRREDLTVSWRQLCVESFGRCQYAGNWIFSPRANRCNLVAIDNQGLDRAGMSLVPLKGTGEGLHGSSPAKTIT